MFDSAKLKLERANHHIGELKAALDAFIRHHRDAIRIDHDAGTGKTTVHIGLREQVPTPPIFSLLIGDAIHNLRTALDHATWELIGAHDSGTQDTNTYFPCAATSRERHEDTCKGIKTPRDDTRTFLTGLAAYKGGAGEDLYNLHRLDIADKHRVLTPVFGIGSASKLELMRDGKPFMTAGNATSVSFHGITPDKLTHKTNFTADIFFGAADVATSSPVIPTLTHFAAAVSDCLGRFETFVGTRG